MSAETRDVTAEYRMAEHKAAQFNPGEQVDIARLMKSAFMHGYARCLLEHDITPTTPDGGTEA